MHPIPISWFDFPAMANQPFHPSWVSELIPDLSRKGTEPTLYTCHGRYIWPTGPVVEEVNALYFQSTFVVLGLVVLRGTQTLNRFKCASISFDCAISAILPFQHNILFISYDIRSTVGEVVSCQEYLESMFLVRVLLGPTIKGGP